MIAVVFAAALVAAGTGLTGLAADPLPSEPVFDTPLPDDIVLPETPGLGTEMKEAFEELLNSHTYKNVLKNAAVTVVEQYKDEIAGLFQDKDVDEIQVSIEVELKKVALEDDGNIQYVQYSVAPKACGFKNGSLSITEKLDGDGYQLGEGIAISLPVPKQYIAENAKAGAYLIRGDEDPPYWSFKGSWLNKSMDRFGEITIVPSRWKAFDEDYYHTLGEDSFWAGTDSLRKGTSVTVSFNEFPFDKIENPFEEYIDCEMSADGGSVVVTARETTDGYQWFYLIREWEDGLELRMPFNVMVIDAP